MFSTWTIYGDDSKLVLVGCCVLVFIRRGPEHIHELFRGHLVWDSGHYALVL